MKIIITGGHLAPALAIIEKIKKFHKEAEIIFVGRKYALDSEKTISLEFKEIEKQKIRFIPLQTGRLTRILTVKTIRNIFRIPLGFVNAFFIVNRERPDKIFSFGSYLAVPIVFWAWLLRIPVYTHEQTIQPGLANKLIGFFSRKIFIAFAEASPYFDQKKTVLCGNPIREAVFKIEKKPFIVNKDRPVIYITGGTLGSHSVNVHIKNIATKLLENYIVIHQVGETKEYNDFESLSEMKNKLAKNLSDRYFLKKHFFEDEIGYVYSLADLVVGRAGANTFFELLARQKPALFIPLPWSAGREQQRHAELFARNKIGEIFHQVEPSEKLLRLINSMIPNLNLYKKNFSSLENHNLKNASQFLVEEIFKNP